MLITSLDYSSYTGRIAVRRVHRGTLKEGMNVTIVKRNGDMLKSKIKDLHVFEGLGRVKTSEVSSGDICALVGIDGFEIGDTVCDFENPEDVYKRQLLYICENWHVHHWRWICHDSVDRTGDSQEKVDE